MFWPFGTSCYTKNSIYNQFVVSKKLKLYSFVDYRIKSAERRDVDPARTHFKQRNKSINTKKNYL